MTAQPLNPARHRDSDALSPSNEIAWLQRVVPFSGSDSGARFIAFTPLQIVPLPDHYRTSRKGVGA